MLTWRFPSARWPKTSVVAPGATRSTTAARPRATNAASSRDGERDVGLVHEPEGRRRLGVRLSPAPQPGDSRRVVGHRARQHRIAEPVERDAELVGEPGRVPRHLHQHARTASGDGRAARPGDARRPRGPTRGAARPRGGEGSARSTGNAATASDDGGHAEQRHQAPDRRRHQAQARRRHDAEGPLAAAEQPGQVVARVVLEQTGEVGLDQLPGAEHRLHAEHLARASIRAARRAARRRSSPPSRRSSRCRAPPGRRRTRVRADARGPGGPRASRRLRR